MSVTGLGAVDTTVEKTNTWLNEIQQRLGWTDRQRAYQALRAVLHALRDRLTVEEAADFAAQLPLLVRGIFYEGWHPAGKPLKERKKEEFLNHVAQAFPNDLELDFDEVTRAVFQVIARHVTSGEIHDVKRLLPKDIRELWSLGSVGAW